MVALPDWMELWGQGRRTGQHPVAMENKRKFLGFNKLDLSRFMFYELKKSHLCSMSGICFLVSKAKGQKGTRKQNVLPNPNNFSDVRMILNFELSHDIYILYSK